MRKQNMIRGYMLGEDYVSLVCSLITVQEGHVQFTGAESSTFHSCRCTNSSYDQKENRDKYSPCFGVIYEGTGLTSEQHAFWP